MSVMVFVAVSQVSMTELIFGNPGVKVDWKASITAMSCCLSKCFQQSNLSQNVVYSQNNMLLAAKLVNFLCSVISQGKVVALDSSKSDWTDICQPWSEGEQPVLLRCLAVSADASNNQTCHRTLFIHKTICCLQRNWSFLCSVISQGKVVALDRWDGKWNHLSMTRRLTTNYAKNYCNRTLIVQVIVENVVTCFFWGDTVYVS